MTWGRFDCNPGRRANFFQELGSTGNYFYGFGEQGHSFGDICSLQKSKKKKKSLRIFCFIFSYSRQSGKLQLANPGETFTKSCAEKI